MASKTLGLSVALLVTSATFSVVAATPGYADGPSNEPSVSVVFAPPAAGSNGNYSVSVTYPETFALPAVSDGVAGATFAFALSGANTAGCSVGTDGSGFTYSGPGTCTVTASSLNNDSPGGSGGTFYGDSSSYPGSENSCDGDNDSDDTDCGASGTLTVTVEPGTQGISVASKSSPVGTPVTLAASGYSGTGAITFALAGGTASGCAISQSGELISTSPGTCLVTGAIAADGDYAGATSAVATITFTALTQGISVASKSSPVGTPVTLAASGYSGTGAITFALAGGTASGCAISQSGELISTSPGTCLVTGAIAADGDYAGATSAVATITFTALIVPSPPVEKTLTLTASSQSVAFASPVNPSVTVSGLGPSDSAIASNVTFTYAGTGATTYGPSSSAPTKAGTYSVTPSNATVVVTPGGDQADYASTYNYVSGTLTITALTLTLTASSQSVAFASPVNPSVTVSGLGPSDSATASNVTFTYAGTGATTYGPSSSAPTKAGTYSVTPSNATVVVTPGGDQADYASTYNYVAGALAIEPAPKHIITNPPRLPIQRAITIEPFAEGSYALDARLKVQVERLAVEIKAGHFTSVNLVGFTDNVFTPAFNSVLTQQRALAVASQLASDLNTLKVKGVTISTVPGVSIELVNSNTTAKGRALNRRVVATIKTS